MICYRCNWEVGQALICPECGVDLHIIQKAGHLSNYYYNDGLKKAEVRNLSGAIVSLQMSLKFNKYNTNARNLLGLIYYEMGEPVDAISEWVISKNYDKEDNRASFYLDAIQKNTDRLKTINQTIRKYNQALVYCRQDSRDLAMIQLKKVISMNPKMVRAHQLLALLNLQEGKLDVAKKSLRNAGKIDTDNTTTLRYLKEVNTRLKEKGSYKKKPEDDLISYQSGNETIIMPKRFRESSLGSNLLYMLIGLAVGIMVTAFLVVPGVRSAARSDAQKQVVKANDENTSNEQKITSLEDSIVELQTQLESAQNISQQVEQRIESYEHLLTGYVLYLNGDIINAGNQLNVVRADDLSDNSKSVFYNLYQEVSALYVEKLYKEAYSKYSGGDYESAIAEFTTVINLDVTYDNGGAVYYLAQAYRRSGNLETAKPYYQYLIDNYPDTAWAQTAKNYVNAEE